MTTTSGSEVSVQEFMGATVAEIAAGLTRARVEAAAREGSSAWKKWADEAAGEGTRAELAGHVAGFLQGSAGEIFAGVWSRCAELRTSAAETKGKPGVTEVVALADHEFSYSMEPEVEVVVDGVALGSFKFSVELNCEVKALELQVREGGIGGVRSGECEGSAAILLAGKKLWEKRLGRVDLPGRLRWARVWAIA